MAVLTDEQKAAETQENSEQSEGQVVEDNTKDILYPKEGDESGDNSDESGNEEENKSEGESKDNDTKKAESENEDKEETDENAETEIVTAENLQFPDGTVIDEEVQEGFLKIINDKDMSPKDRAQSIINLQQNMIVKAQEAHQAVIDKWGEDAKVDKVIAGDDGTKFDENIALSRKGLDALKIDGLSELLVDSGYGNHPTIVRMFMKIGQWVSEDSFINGSSQVTKESKKTHNQILYPNDTKKE